MWRIVTYKKIANGTPNDDNGYLERLCNTLNRNEKDCN